MRLPPPAPAYDQDNERNTRSALIEADSKNLKRGQDITEEPIIRASPNGSRWALGVADDGTTTWTPA